LVVDEEGCSGIVVIRWDDGDVLEFTNDAAHPNPEKIANAVNNLLMYRLSDIEAELISQDKKGNLRNGAGVYLLVLLNKAVDTLENASLSAETGEDEKT